MKRVFFLAAAIFFFNTTADYSGFLSTRKVEAQGRGRIVGEVFVRENDNGKKSLLIAIDNDCGKGEGACEKQLIDKVKVRIEDVNLPKGFTMPKLPKFEDTNEYKKIAETLAQSREKWQKETDKKASEPIPVEQRQLPGISEAREYREFINYIDDLNGYYFDFDHLGRARYYYPNQYNLPPPYLFPPNLFPQDKDKTSPIPYDPSTPQGPYPFPTGYSLEDFQRTWESPFSKTWFEDFVLDEKDLLLTFAFKYRMESFNPTSGVRARVDIEDKLIPDLEDRSVKIEVENKGKRVFKKTVKPVKLPKIERKNIPAKDAELPNILHPGKAAYFSLDKNSFKDKMIDALPTYGKPKNLAQRMTQDYLKGIKIVYWTAQTIKEFGKGERTIIGIKRGPVVIPESKMKVPGNPNTAQPGAKDKKQASDATQTQFAGVKNGKTIFEALPSPEAKPGDKVGATILNEFGEELTDIIFPDVNIVDVFQADKRKSDNENPDRDNDSSDGFSGQNSIEDQLDNEYADRVGDAESGNVSNDVGGDDESTDDIDDNVCYLGLTEASRYVIEDRKLCLCGCFFEYAFDWNNASNVFNLDGKPIMPVALSQSTASFEIPEGTTPGLHKLTYKNPSGKIETVEFRVLGVQGTIDQNRMWTGQGTNMMLRILGTIESLPLFIENQTPEIISITGGNSQIVNSSGGESNQIQRLVIGISRGKFAIDYSLDQPTCPCLKKD